MLDFNGNEPKEIRYDDGIILPDGYTRLEYIESTGTQYIDTNVQPTNDIDIEVTFKTTDSIINYQKVFGQSSLAGFNSMFHLQMNNDNKTSWSFFIAGRNTNMILDATENTRNFKFISGEGIYIDGILEQQITTTTQNSYNIWLFRGYDRYSRIQIYSSKIFKGNTPVRNFIPARRNSDNELGLYDTVNDVFYTNQGTGSFVAGNEYKGHNVAKVVVKEALPEGYTRLEYIESTGTQYIDTGVIADNETGFLVDVQKITDNGTDQVIIGSRVDSGNTRCWIDLDGTGSSIISNLIFGWGQLTNGNYRIDLGYNRIKGKFNFYNDRKVYLNDELKNYYTSQLTEILPNQTENLYVCGANYVGFRYPFLGYIYNIKISKGNTLIRNYIPAQRNIDNEVGLYDTVNDVFYTNQGTGQFVAGGEDTGTVVWKGLPSTYTRLEYIESTGTQYIDTGVIPNNTMSIDVKARALQASFILGCRISRYSSENTLMFEDGTRKTVIRWGNTQLLENSYTINNDYKIHIENEKSYIDDITSSVSYGNNYSNYNIYMFAINQNGMSTTNIAGLTEYNRTRIYSCKIYDNNTLVRNYIPARRNSDNELGLYDTVNDVFYTNQGTGSFIAGEYI